MQFQAVSTQVITMMNEEMMSEMMGMMNGGGLKDVMMEDTFEDEETGHQFSQADILADVINILRMDTKRIGKAVGIEIEVSRMTPGRAAEMLEQMAMPPEDEENQLEDSLIDIFDEIEEQRMDILEELVGEDRVDEHMELKRAVLYSHPDTPNDIEVGGDNDNGDNDED